MQPEDPMSTSNSILERFMRVLTRATRSKPQPQTDQQAPIRWLNLR
jgi:hypothetical protein